MADNKTFQRVPSCSLFLLLAGLLVSLSLLTYALGRYLPVERLPFRYVVGTVVATTLVTAFGLLRCAHLTRLGETTGRPKDEQP